MESQNLNVTIRLILQFFIDLLFAVIIGNFLEGNFIIFSIIEWGRGG